MAVSPAFENRGLNGRGDWRSTWMLAGHFLGREAQVTNATVTLSRAPYHPSTHAMADLTSIASGTPDRCAEGSLRSDIMVPMRDGVRLATDVYLPDAAGPFPAILVRLPYGKTDPHCALPPVARHWTRKGYACVVQDVRGKWGSEGAFKPADGATETADGYDTLAWLADQDFCNGAIGMWGESYYGFTSYAGAVSGHPALRAIAPGNIGVDRYRNVFRGGAFQFNTMGNWALSMVVSTAQDVIAADPWHLPLAEIPAKAGLESPYYQDMLANPRRGPFWAARSLLTAYDRIRIPVLCWGGWYDNFLGGQLHDFRLLTERNKADGLDHIYLFVGPWDHSGSAEQTDRIGANFVGLHGAHRWDKYQTFFDRYVMGLDNGFDRGPRVEYFTIGASEWRRSPSWPPPDMVPTPFYLSSGGRANTLAGDRRLSPTPPAEEPTDHYDYDPLDPVADTVDMNCWSMASELRDRTEVERRADVLVYSTPPLAEPLEITGPIEATIHAASSAVDTDFWLGLVDVSPDGYGTLIQDGILRASARFGDQSAPPLRADEIVAYRIDLWAASYLLKAGHRLRLEVTSSCFNKFNRNTNTGQPIGQADRTVVARQTIYHDAQHPSLVMLPLARPAG